jgi:hypothetical protein
MPRDWARQDEERKSAESSRCEDGELTMHLEELKQRASTIVD